ncbi:sensor histidine kinase [Colwellia sp. MB02u-14]|uniref:sensor histidine kinase n=1 Tax=Colwellia sp. MB02u-14 TaxID=2759815 RepID=UPI0015F63D70|nr:ATP-binding protein [Colwellia sp. MB02u-14]MBA6304518.1 two-component sensor histidine kinase [Colwellia sp. MB02u-14]
MKDALESLRKQLAVYERKAQRERKARCLAEQQLENYSRELYETNQSLQASLVNAKKKQAELEFLAKASDDVISKLSMTELMLNTVELTGNFFSAEYGFFLVTKLGSTVDFNNTQLWNKETGWSLNQEFLLAYMEYLPLAQDAVYQSWSVVPIPLKEKGQLAGFNWLVYFNIQLHNEQKVWITFLSRAEYLDKESLFVLDTAKGHLLSSIRRRLNDVQMIENKSKLNDSVTSLERAKGQLMQYEKMALLGQLSAGVAHEINNPIAFIRSNMEILLDDLKVYNALYRDIKHHLSEHHSLNLESFEQFISEADIDYIATDAFSLLRSNIDGIDRVRDIVDSLKTFSHSGKTAFCEMSIVGCIEGALKVSSLRYNHNIENELTDYLPFIMGNKGQLQQVFVNLFVNASYAMDNDGVLSITGRETDDSLIIRVSDTGSGMDKKILKQLFTPFFTTKPVGEGTGLGLSVSFAIIEAHDATITVKSIEGVGTTFEISFIKMSVK